MNTEFDFVRQRISVGISELGVNYRRSAIVAEDHRSALGLHAFPGPRAGGRVPEVALEPTVNDGAARLFDRLRGTRHHLLFYSSRETSPPRMFTKTSVPWRGRSATALARGSSHRS
jgi:hypothetical protein